MVALYAQSQLEWVARQTVMQYLYWGVAALVYALSREQAPARSPAAESGEFAPATRQQTA